MHPNDLWYGQSLGARLSRLALTPASWLYAAGWQAYMGVYALGLKAQKEPHRPIVCVGNLVSGGSGKTPATLAIADILLRQGRKVIIGMSGYGSPRARAASSAPAGELDPAEWGDEPAMARWLRPGLPIVVGRRRVLAARLAHEMDPGAVLVMDDGFQHLPVRKHVTLLIDPNPANERCLPAGPYREPRSNRKRADLVFGGQFTLERQPLRFVTADGLPSGPPRQSVALCALGDPDQFAASLESASVGVVGRRFLPDHDQLTEGTLWDGVNGNATVAVTAKDWVKLRRRSDIGERQIVIALQDVAIEPADEFANWLRSRLTESSSI